MKDISSGRHSANADVKFSPSNAPMEVRWIESTPDGNQVFLFDSYRDRVARLEIPQYAEGIRSLVGTGEFKSFSIDELKEKKARCMMPLTREELIDEERAFIRDLQQ